MIYLLTMRRFIAIVLGLTASACSTAAAPAGAQDAPREPLRTIDVTGTATVMRAPDRAAVHLAVETVAETARAARRGNAEAMTAVIDALEGLGLEPAAIRTVSVSLNPQYQRGRDVDSPTIVAYQAANRVRVRVDEIDRVGRVVDAAVASGANRVTGIQFELSDPEAAYHEALERAVAEARREAETLARALGETLGPVIRVSTGGFRGPIPQGRGRTSVQMEAVSTPIEPGELEVRATAHITYRLGP